MFFDQKSNQTKEQLLGAPQVVGTSDQIQEGLPVSKSGVYGEPKGLRRGITNRYKHDDQTAQQYLKSDQNSKQLFKQLQEELKEPEDIIDKRTSLLCNMVEEILLVSLMFGSAFVPTFISAVYALLSFIVLLWKADQKEYSLQFQVKFSKAVLIILGLEIISKILIMALAIDLNNVSENLSLFNSFGIQFIQINQQYQFDYLQSIKYEIWVLIAYVLLLIYSQFALKDIQGQNILYLKAFFLLDVVLVSVKGKNNTYFNDLVVILCQASLIIQLIEHILLNMKMSQDYIAAHSFEWENVIILLASAQYLPKNKDSTKLATFEHLLQMLTAIFFASLWRSAQQARKERKIKEQILSKYSIKVDVNYEKESDTSQVYDYKLKRLNKLNQALLQKEKKSKPFSWKEFRNEFLTLKPWTLTWIACYGELLIAYSYNNKLGLIHLTWALLTYILPLKILIYISIFLMMPLLFVGFFFMYIFNIKGLIKNNTLNDTIYSEFYFKFKYPSLELTILYMLLLVFCLMIHSRKDVSKKHMVMRDGFFKRVKSDSSSVVWKLLFFFFRYLHVIVLLTLFFMGVNEVNFYRLGLMFFFLMYAISQNLYRRTGFLLVIFVSTFIWGQYLWTLIYDRDWTQNKQAYQILKLINWVHDFKRNESNDIYFDYYPPLQFWVILLLMVILSQVNIWYQDSEQVKKLENHCDESISRKYPKTMKIFKRAGYIIKEIIVFIIILVMGGINANQRPTIINFILMMINIFFLGVILAGDKRTYSICVTTSKILKVYSALILLFSVIFTLVVNSKYLENTDLDEAIWKRYPLLAENTDILGFTNYSRKKQSELWGQLASYLFILFFAIILENLYTSLMNEPDEETEEEIKEIFEDEFKLKAYHEKKRFTLPFVVYKLNHWWPVFDNIALYFHIITNTVLFSFALYFEVSLFMGLNIMCFAFFYIFSSIHLHRQAQKESNFHGTKIGLDQAYITSKWFRLKATQSFLRLRIKLWYFQYFLLLFALILIYPSADFEQIMERYPETKEGITNVLFYLFWGGFYRTKDLRSDYTYIIPQFTLLFLLILEKLSQKWLLNRFYCSQQKIIYYKEVELRLEFLQDEKNKEEMLPEYKKTKLIEKSEKEEGKDFVTYGEARQYIEEIKTKFRKEEDEELRLQKLKEVLEAAIRREASISRAKANSILLQQLSLLCLLLSSVFKSNIFSCFYALCVLIYVAAKSKTKVMPYIIAIIGICFVTQYFLTLFNLTSMNSPMPFPEMFAPYPNQENPNGQFMIPVFSKFEDLKIMKNTYFYGMGIEHQSLTSLWFDLINLYAMTVYFLLFRNPILRRGVKKISWKNTLILHHQGIEYLKDEALKEYTQILFRRNQAEVKITEQDRLEQIKEQVYLHSLIKRLSTAIYLISPLFTMAVILLFAIIGRSIISFGYILIILPYLSNSLNYLRQVEFSKRKWSFIFVISYVLLGYAYIDFLTQIVFQFPFLDAYPTDAVLGLRKTWKLVDDFTYEQIIGQTYRSTFVEVSRESIYILFFKCGIIFFASLQGEIFRSSGFKAFIAKQDSGLHKLMEIRRDKALCMTYDFNNKKLKEIVAIQKTKKQNLEVVKEIKNKIKLWRRRQYYDVAQDRESGTIEFVDPSDMNREPQKRDSQNPIRSFLDTVVKMRSSSKEVLNQRDTIVQQKNKQLKKVLLYRLLREQRRKLPCCASFFHYLIHKFSNPILFVDRAETIHDLKRQLSDGGKATYTPIEKKLLLDLRIYLKEKEFQLSEQSVFQNNYASEQNEDLKLENMRHTMEYIKFTNLIKQFGIHLMQILASNTHNFAYLFMILSMYFNPSILTLVYPLSLFGYALLEETRAGRKFWNYIIYYTIGLLLLKFGFQFWGYAEQEQSDFFRYLQVGMFSFDSTSSLIGYVLPEICILFFSMAHCTHSKLLGLFKNNETEIEPIIKAIYRNMNYNPDQKKNETPDQEFKRIWRETEKEVNELLKREEPQDGRNQEEYNEFAHEVHDYLQSMKIEQKKYLNHTFNFDQDELEMKIKQIKEAKARRKRKGFFERNKYFLRLFPTMKAQKPGYDLYVFTTLVLFALCFYIIFYYNEIVAIGINIGTQSIFQSGMVITLCFHFALLVFERFISRTDTKISKKKAKLRGMLNNFNINQLEQRKYNSMSIHLQTMRVGDQDLRSKEATEALRDFDGLDEIGADATDSIEIDKTKITIQQKSKFILHWTMLILVHIFIFWYYPIQGNLALYGAPSCDIKNATYGCKNFKYNPYLKVAYGFYLLYFIFSSLQIRYGLPQFKRVTSTAYDNQLSYVGHLIYANIPFVIELKCLLDFSFTDTALDIFQWWQLNIYYSELYVAKMGNMNYYVKKLGEKISGLEKCIFGFCLSAIVLAFLIGPFILFSDLGGVSKNNLVRQSQIELNLVIRDAINKQSIAPLTYNLYKTQNPYIYTFNEKQFDDYGFNKYPETKFFDFHQVQTIIPSKYSDEDWQISQENLKLLINYLDRQQNGDDSFDVIVQLKYFFHRDGPENMKIVQGSQEIVLNSKDENDTQAINDLIAIKDFNCDEILKNPDEDQVTYKEVVFQEFWNNKVQLGSKADIKQINIAKISKEDQKKSLKLTYICKDQWTISDEDGNDLEIITFNEDISAGFLEGYSIMTFYFGVIYVIGTTLRTMVIFITPRAFIYEISDPEALLKLCEYIHQMRHEKNLEKEEEYYMILVEILRSPELLKALTGSSLKGELAPKPQKNH